MSTAIHPSTVTPAQLAQQFSPYSFGGDAGITGQLSQLSQLGQLGHLGQLGQIGVSPVGHLGQLGQLGHLTHLNQLGGQFGQFGRMSPVTGPVASPFAATTPQVQMNPIALICEYLAVQQAATTIATQLIAALLPAVQQSQYSAGWR